MPGLGLGLRLAPRLELGLRLQLRQAFEPANLGVDPFRTQEETAQVTQYEVLRELEGIVSGGEFFDAYHFSLEINRRAFAKSLKALLTGFARDLSDLVKGYECDEGLARQLMQILSATEKEGQDRKDAPGRIVSAWNRARKSPYFPDEATRKTLLSMAGALQDRACDLTAGFSLLAQAAKVPSQPSFMEVTLQKLEEYSLADSRIIPFAQDTVGPLIRALAGEGSPLSPEQARACYERIVEAVYMLDRQAHVHQTLELVRESAQAIGVGGVLEWSIPVPIMAYVSTAGLSPELRDRALELCTQAEFVQGREVQRNVYKGLAAVRDYEQGSEVVLHVVSHCHSAKGLARVLSAVNLVHADPDFQYPFELTTEEDILRNLRLQLTDKSIKRLQLRDEVLEKYIARIEKDERFSCIGKVITTLAGYSHYQNPEQMELLRQIVEQELGGVFAKWRYSHNCAKDQLRILGGNVESWRENARVMRLVGELAALSSHIDAVKHLLPKMEESYEAYYHKPVSGVQVSQLQGELARMEDELRKESSGREKKELGFAAAKLREQTAYTRVLASIADLTIETYPGVLEQAQVLARKKTNHPLYEAVKWVGETLDQPEYRDARKIEVYETDDLETLLRFGETPVPHCQNWKINSELNKSLLSFVADANKKLYLIASREKPISMSMERLVDAGGYPALLIENVYANEWSDDYGIALMGSVLDKAVAMHEETGLQVLIASNCAKLVTAMEYFSKKYHVEIEDGSLDFAPVPSMNPWEYWDCIRYHTGQAMRPSGSEVSVDLKWVVIGRNEDQDE